MLTNDQAIQWSLTDDDKDDTEQDEWTIKAVKLVDHGKNDKNGKKRLEYHGLDAHRTHWWPIKFGTMIVALWNSNSVYTCDTS